MGLKGARTGLACLTLPPRLSMRVVPRTAHGGRRIENESVTTHLQDQKLIAVLPPVDESAWADLKAELIVIAGVTEMFRGVRP
jgi:hypothetical protein